MKHLSLTEKCVVKKTGDGHTVWFPPSQSFVFLKFPAYEAFKLMEEGKGNRAIIESLMQLIRTPENEIRDFIIQLRLEFDRLMNPGNLKYKPIEFSDELKHYTFTPFRIKNYIIKGVSFQFIYENNELFQQFDSLLSHLSVDISVKTHYIFEFFTTKNVLAFRLNGKLIEHFSSDHLHYLKGAVLKKIAGLIYTVSDDEWMASFHASAVSDGKNAILFSAQPGGGKSTVAALLQSKGYLLLSDDFITMDNQKEHVWQMPYALSVKEGSVKLLSKEYPQLKVSSLQTTLSGKQVNYLPPRTNLSVKASSFPVKYIIFIQYSPDINFLLEKIEKEEAIMSLLAETWVNPQRSNVQQFLNWFEHLECIRLTYSDHEKLFEEITKRFKL
jgi:hypothetical protein